MKGCSIYLSLGSNLGNRLAQLEEALNRLQDQGVRVVKRSSVYETEPVEVKGQADFLNLVCEVESRLDPNSLLTLCEQVETELDRTGKGKRQARRIDIDILFYGERVVSERRLKIPHPGLYRREFVLIPLQEIAPDWHDPATGKTVRSLRRECAGNRRVRPYTK